MKIGLQQHRHLSIHHTQAVTVCFTMRVEMINCTKREQCILEAEEHVSLSEGHQIDP